MHYNSGRCGLTCGVSGGRDCERQGVRYTIDYGRLNNQEYYSRIVRFTPNLPEPGHLPNGKGSTEASMSTRPVLAPGVCIYK